MTPKSYGYTCTRAELIEEMRRGSVLWWNESGPHINHPRAPLHGRHRDSLEMHPRSDTVKKMLAEGVIVESSDANDVQRRCGMYTYRATADPRKE